MATLIPNLFTTYQLTDDEQLQGMVLNEAQKYVLQNEQARLAEERSLLVIDSENIIESAQAEAYKRGQLDLVAWILESSESANMQLNDPEYDPENPTEL